MNCVCVLCEMGGSLTVTVGFLNTQKSNAFYYSTSLRKASDYFYMCVCVFACTHFCK